MSRNGKILLGVIFCGFLTRFAFLGSDPSILLDSGQVGDEGFWLYNARSLALFGTTVQDQFYHDYAAAPLFSFLATISFLIFGAGFWQARLISALAGLLAVIVTYKIGLLFGKKTALLSALLVSVNTLLILHSRLAVGESLQILLVNASLYLFLIKKSALSGSFLAAGILAKTTAILYVPSFTILSLLSLIKRRFELSEAVKFWAAFLVTFLVIFGPILFLWSDKISLIYQTFGDWLKPQNLTALFNSLSGFFTHPFWGSPFNFSLAMLASFNVLNYFISVDSKGSVRRLLIFWTLGILVLGPLVSRISNARLLPLIIPMAVLSAETILNKRIGKIDLEDLLSKISKNSLIEKLILFIATIPLSFITAKILLALAKRIFNQELIVQYLPHLSLILIPVLWCLILILKGKLTKPLLAGLVSLIILFPFLGTVRVSASLFEFFRLIGPLNTQSASLIILGSYLLFAVIFAKLSFDFGRVKNLLIWSYFAFNLLGVSTVLLSPSYNFVNASRDLGNIADTSAVVGFYGHELSLENKITPIYWAPRLEKVNVVNSDFPKYNPEYLLQRQSFDLPFKPDVWPTASDIGNVQIVKTLDLSRNFLSARRDFRLVLFKINY